MIKVSDLIFEYNKIKVLDMINIEFKPNNIYGIIGENGSGKTTLLNCLANHLRPNNGSIKYNDIDIYNNSIYSAKVALLNDYVYIGVYNGIKLLSNLSKYYGVKPNLELYLKMCHDLKIDCMVPLHKQSTGYKKMNLILIYIALDIDILVLDEFLDGIDILNNVLVKKLLFDYVMQDNKMIILASHFTSDINDLCDQIIIISDNKIKKITTIDNLKAGYLKYQFVFKDSISETELLNLGINFIDYKIFDNIIFFTVDHDTSVDPLLNWSYITYDKYGVTLEEAIINEYSK